MVEDALQDALVRPRRRPGEDQVREPDRSAGDEHAPHLPDQPLRALLDQAPKLYPEFYALTYDNMRLALVLLGNLAVTPSEARVAARLLMHAELDGAAVLSFPQTKFAELVGLSSATLQRVLKRLQEERLIRVGYGQIEILDRAGLLRVCNP